MSMSVKFIDLFCGIGGFHTAIKRVLPNSECVMACDIDEQAQQTYERNYFIKPEGDIKAIDITKIPKFDLLCGGFPCQSFSVAQWKETKGFDDPRGTLFFDILKIIDAHHPSVVLLENVSNIARIEKGSIMKTIIDSLKSRNYIVSYEILNAKNFGIPQNRERIYIVGTKHKPFKMKALTERTSSTQLCDILEEDLNDNVWLEENKYTLLEQQNVKTQPKSGLKFIGYINAALRKKGALENTEHLSRVHKQINRIYSSLGTNPTISASETSGRYYIFDENKNKVRKLTLTECYRLMDFPNTFVRHSNISRAYHQIGNSVCVKVVESIIQELVNQELL